MITTPYSLVLGRDDDARDVVAGTTANTVAGKMKLFLGASVDPTKRQSIMGAVEILLKEGMRTDWRGDTSSGGTVTIYGPYDQLNYSNVVRSAAAPETVVGDNDVSLSVPNTFMAGNQTHFITETAHQLANVLLERSKDN